MFLCIILYIHNYICNIYKYIYFHYCNGFMQFQNSREPMSCPYRRTRKVSGIVQSEIKGLRNIVDGSKNKGLRIVQENIPVPAQKDSFALPLSFVHFWPITDKMKPVQISKSRSSLLTLLVKVLVSFRYIAVVHAEIMFSQLFILLPYEVNIKLASSHIIVCVVWKFQLLNQFWNTVPKVYLQLRFSI